jgi:hypothetical protein
VSHPCNGARGGCPCIACHKRHPCTISSLSLLSFFSFALNHHQTFRWPLYHTSLSLLDPCYRYSSYSAPFWIFVFGEKGEGRGMASDKIFGKISCCNLPPSNLYQQKTRTPRVLCPLLEATLANPSPLPLILSTRWTPKPWATLTRRALHLRLRQGYVLSILSEARMLSRPAPSCRSSARARHGRGHLGRECHLRSCFLVAL